MRKRPNENGGAEMLPFFFYAFLKLNCIQFAEYLPNITDEKHRKSTNFHELKTDRKSAENPHKIKVFQHSLKNIQMVRKTGLEPVQVLCGTRAYGVSAEYLPNILGDRYLSSFSICPSFEDSMRCV